MTILSEQTIGVTSSTVQGERFALIVGHPGHELRVFHWMELHRPLCFCITDGSGGASESRIDSMRRVLDTSEARTGAVFGRFSDKETYRMLLDGRVDVFADLTRELAKALVDDGTTCVAGDAVEGFNPVHDVCRFMIDGAVEMVQRQTGRRLQNYEFVLEAPPNTCPDELRGLAVWVQLDDAAVDRKVKAATECPELREEVRAALARFGKKAFSLECLRPPTTRLMLEGFETELPAYERYGVLRKAQGRYDEIIRYREHVLPVLEAIEKAVRESPPFPA